MKMLKQTLLYFMWASGALTPFRIANRGKILILTYHRFSEREDGVWTSARAFRQQLEYLTEHHNVMSLGQIVTRCSQGLQLPPGTAAITIDDGYRDAYEIAFPILVRYQLPATVFVVTDFVDRKAWLWTDKLRFVTARTRASVFKAVIGDRTFNLEMTDAGSRFEAAARVNAALKLLPDDFKEETIVRIASSLGVELPEVPPVEMSSTTWSQLREMERAGLEIVSHTLTHPLLTKVQDDRLSRELRESRARLESMLGHPVDQFCYPHGAYSARVREAVASAGYRCGVTTKRGLNGRQFDSLTLRRIHTEPDFPHFVQSASGAEDMKGKLRALVD